MKQNLKEFSMDMLVEVCSRLELERFKINIDVLRCLHFNKIETIYHILACDENDLLDRIKPEFHSELMRSVEQLLRDCEKFLNREFESKIILKIGMFKEQERKNQKERSDKLKSEINLKKQKLLELENEIWGMENEDFVEESVKEPVWRDVRREYSHLLIENSELDCQIEKLEQNLSSNGAKKQR